MDLVASGTAPVSFAYDILLNDLPDPTDFTNLYDQYRILQAEIRYIPIYGPGEFPGNIYSVIDYDDANTIGVFESYQYESLQVTGLDQAFVRTFTPKVAEIVYNGNLTVAYGQPRGPRWIDVASPSVPHYGLKLAITTITGAPANITLGQLVVTVTLQCKNPR